MPNAATGANMALAGIVGVSTPTAVQIVGSLGLESPVVPGVGLPTSTVLPVQEITPTLTFIPSPTVTASVVAPVVMQGLYSYYFPDLGGVNCHGDNWIDDKCKNTSASSMGWRDKLGWAVAVSPTEYGGGVPVFPYGSWLVVTSPAEIAGRYLVFDLCQGCYRSDGFLYFDFLDNTQKLEWSTPILYYVDY